MEDITPAATVTCSCNDNKIQGNAVGRIFSSDGEEQKRMQNNPVRIFNVSHPTY
jgi:hypothetical protein